MRVLLIISMISTTAVAKDFGIQGTVYPIAERNPVAVIEEQLRELDLSELENLLIQSTAEKKLFVPLEGWKPTAQPRRFPYDPTYTVPRDIKDHKGRVLFKKGERVNPLQIMPMEKTLLFIDGRDETQVQWVLNEYTQSTKIILVAGSPNQLMKIHQRTFYFDQKGHLLKTFGITQIPAVISISEGEVWVNELKLEEADDV